MQGVGAAGAPGTAAVDLLARLSSWCGSAIGAGHIGFLALGTQQGHGTVSSVVQSCVVFWDVILEA